jgi:hypothetical protein
MFGEFLVVIQRREVLLINGKVPGMLLNSLQYTGQPLQ